jgi:hypothetical protein
MRRVVPLVVVFVCVAALLSAQSNSSNKYQPALVLGVKEHQGPIPAQILQNMKDQSGTHYDVSIRLKSNKAEYVLLYTPPPGRYGFQFTSGMDKLVLVESDTVTFNDLMGRSITAPILSRTPAQQ